MRIHRETLGKREAEITIDVEKLTRLRVVVIGIIGANGSGKSTFLKIISGEIDPTSGQVHLEPGKRMSVLSQNHYAFDDYQVLEAVMIGNKMLFELKKEMDAIYAKEDFSEEDGIKAGELGVEFEEMDGWNAESDAATLLSSLGIKEDFHYTLMSELDGKAKVRVLLAQALFGNPDILLLDEPTNGLDVMATRGLRQVILRLKDAGHCVLFSSHVMQEVAALCDEIVVISNGKVAASGSPDSLRSLTGKTSLEDAFVKAIGSEEGLA